MNRREFVLSSAALAMGPALRAVPSPAPLTVGEVLARIHAQPGVVVRSETVDHLLVGSLTTPVRGMATTMMATFEVCKRAQALGANFVVTHETPFYLHQDKTEDIAGNAVLRAKKAFLDEHGMAILHFHDTIHDMRPDGVAEGMLEQLGWKQHQASPEDPKRLRFDGVSLEALAGEIATKLNDRTLRVVGDPKLPVHDVRTSWGYCSREGGIAILAEPSAEVLICGETREWELVPYVQDAVTSGQQKALIIVGHVLSEQGGMAWATGWLRHVVPEVTVTFVPAPEPFWQPQGAACGLR